MSQAHYKPGPATGATIDKEGDKWALVVTRELRHPPEKVWRAITEPEHLREWAPFDADKTLGSGATVKLTTVGAPQEHVTETKITRAEEPRLLEYSWGHQEMRWQLDANGSGGTRLRLWHKIPKGFIAMGAAGWHVCFDVLERALAGEPIGRIVGPDAMKIDGWQRLLGEYATELGVELPKW